MKRKQHFYHQVVEIDSLFVELDTLDLTDSEKHHLGELIDSNLHHTVLDAILSELADEDKKLFMHHLGRDDHGKIWELLNTKVEGIEDKIKKAAKDVREELHEDVKEAKKLK